MVGEVALVPTFPAGAGPSQPGGTSQHKSSGGTPNRRDSARWKGRALAKYAGKAHGRCDPEEVSPLLNGGRWTDLGRQIGPKPL